VKAMTVYKNAFNGTCSMQIMPISVKFQYFMTGCRLGVAIHTTMETKLQPK